jgi:hypothetical protein
MNPFLDCRACVERASDHVDGDLRGAAHFVTRVHLWLCKDCRIHVRQLRATVKVLGDVGSEPTLGADRKRALLEALRAKR